jgi:hypothetical protein
MDASEAARLKGHTMADEDETLLGHPGSPEVATHVRDYERFTTIFKYGAITCLIIGLIVLLILK